MKYYESCSRQAVAPRLRGAALLTALAFAVIISLLVGGVATVTVSHYSRAKVEANYALAMQQAEAGVNYELRWISQDTTDPNRPNQKVPSTGQNGPYSGAVAGVQGTFTVYVTNQDGSSPWVAPNDMLITSTGTVNGCSRTVQVKGVRKSVFDEYALFADKSGVFGGAGSSSGSTRIIGNFGTNGPLTFNGTSGTGTVVGDITYNGYTPNQSGSNVYYSGDPVQLPTVSETADSLFGPNGLVWLQTHNNNANIRQLKSTDTSLASITTKTGLTLTDLGTLLDSAGYTVSSRTFGDPGNGTPSDTSVLDAPGGTRFASSHLATDGSTIQEGVKGQRVIFVPPGDYYFNHINFKSGNSAIVMLTHLGRIRIWVDGGGTGGGNTDTLATIVIFTDASPSKFRLFYNNPNTLSIQGSSLFAGGFYAVANAGSGVPMLDFTGNTMIYGSVITSYFKLGGGTQVVFPNDGSGADPTDFSLWFGFKDGWREVNPSGGSNVFVDGTPN